MSDIRIPSPFGTVELPSLEVPSLKMPKLDERRKEAIRQTIGADAATIFNLIPYVGGFISEQIGDLHMREVHKLLTSEEWNQYMDEERRYPTNIIPVMAALVKTGLRR
jgi:N-formylglutamate amidohydrolase